MKFNADASLIEAGVVRFEVERQLNRCLKLHGGADLSVPGALNANVVSGNFYVAEKIGMVNGKLRIITSIYLSF